MGQQEAEILIHAAAPSRASDDLLYRALAQAYLDFEPVNTIEISKTSIQSVQPPKQRSCQLHSFIRSPNLSFQGVQDNKSSPGLRTHTLMQPESRHDGPSQNSSWVAPPSVVADSQPDNNMCMATFCSQPRLFLHLQRVNSSSEFARPAFHDGDSSKTDESVALRQAATAATTIESDQVGDESRISETILISDPTASQDSNVQPQHDRHLRSSRSRDNPAAEETGPEEYGRQTNPSENRAEQAIHEALSQSSPVNVIPATRADSAPPTNKRRKVADGSDLTGLIRSSSDGLVAQTLHRSAATVVPFPGDNNLDIYSPDPPTSCDTVDPSTLVTPKLLKLASDLDMNKRYKPSEQLRQLEPFERGYWLLDTSDWDDELLSLSWTFLTNYVGCGDAGWGVWCKRDESRTWIRLYCFGKVVGHAYLLLYLASQRRVLSTGCEWHGGDGKTLVRVAPRKKR